MKLNYQKSIKEYSKALKIYESIPEEDKSSLLNNIGSIYRKSMMFKTAEEYYVLSINERRLKSPFNYQMLYTSHYELAIVQREQGKLDSSLKNLDLAFNYTQDNKNKVKIY